MSTFLSNAELVASFKFRPSKIKSLVREGRMAMVWLAITALTTGFLVPHIYRRSVDRHFHDLLRAELYRIYLILAGFGVGRLINLGLSRRIR
ncbi:MULTISPECIES: hypothetical protein [Rhizobium]|uniref:Uncharacterized protein n=1 Tax=Rhizobium tumorigenes TaxID=2041385 RepID=A0AAF1KN72_9HYPH|nr:MULTISPECIES: hypothetical protein [Rhizobium]MBO9101991.1 hypothetical protein [Rhizobium sp. L58/93]MBO9172184.1 hypothetical protein [Rhizobium sp. L245/93]MBO9187924.1 hypothetical protein [Rhizobium sp. E27B/91]QXZ87552.1 hypothetical protein J5287_28020 [Rhizobium sp. K1/93]QXZ93592.1 hypothetical protein J5280_28020 [Rhizobium sp. K15/93]